MAKVDFKNLTEEIRKVRLKVTPARLTILHMLKSQTKPLTIGEIKDRLGAAHVDLVTVYRNVELLVKTGIAKKVLFSDNEAFYEYNEGHHHHFVCRNCGRIEDFHICNASGLIKQALSHSKHFSSVNEHSMEFFGFCKTCTIN